MRILNSNNWLTEVYIYDEDGNIIQVKRVNEFGGIDIVTTQYSWSGQLLVNVFKSSKDGDIANQTIWITRNTLDELGRVVKVEKQFVTNLAGVSKKNVNRTIAQYQYDALGNVREKKLGTDPSNTANALETQVFDYNVRGWLLGMNRNELRVNNNQTGSYFAFDLGYDKLINISGRNYSNTQYNGNVAGMIWESKGDGIRRKYDFTYDRANRFLRAGYIQNDAGSTWGTTKMSFSMYMGGTSSATGPQAYDLNGNILRVLTNGYVLGSTSIQQIDHLNYNYETGTNRLLKVTDTASSSGNGKLGDFLQGEHTGDDYAYDEMGNLTMDKNKGVDSILYNHLHKVSRIVMKNNQGTIDYEYDAAGNKLKKITRVNNVEKDSLTTDITTTTYYYGNEIYVTMAYSNATLQNKYGVSDELQLILFEEGRIRLAKSVVTDSSDFQFDYFLKDHLGNVRSVITEEVRTDYYIAASMEDAAAALENVFYTNLDETRVDKPAGYPSTPGTKVAKVGGSTSQPSVGPGKLLRVMAGDKVSMAVTSWWSSGLTSVNTVNVAAPLLDLLSMAIPAGSGGKIAQAGVPGTVLSPAIASFLNTRNPNTPAKPKAFLNWVLFDEQLNYVADGSNAQVVGADGVLTLLSRTNLPISKNGYLYVYVSNVSENIPVYFDDLQVTHERGALLEETHYYPFGLVMHGISSKAFGSLQNSYKFNGGSELNEDFGLQWYETGARLYDPQLGRFLQIDGLADIYSDWSPYVFALNNPTRYIDPTGLEPEDPAEETRKIPGCEDGSCLWNVIVRPGQDVEYYWGESNFGAHIQQYRGGNHTGPMTGGGHGKVYKAAETVLEIGEYIPGVGGKVATGVKVVFYYFNGEKEQAREALWDLLPFRKFLKKLSMANKALGVVQDAGKAAQRAAAKVAASAAKTVGKFSKVPPGDLTKLKGGQGWRDKQGNIWKKDMKHKDHWDVTDPKTGKKVKEIDFEGNQIWPDGPKNKNKR